MLLRTGRFRLWSKTPAALSVGAGKADKVAKVAKEGKVAKDGKKDLKSSDYKLRYSREYHRTLKRFLKSGVDVKTSKDRARWAANHMDDVAE